MAPPPCRPRSTLPALMEELIDEILIRIPPDEPAHLVRAALVCKPWRRILSDPGFLRRYRAFHRHRPPLLGFFYNDWKRRHRYLDIPCFKPAAAAFPSLPEHHYHYGRRRAGRVLDCRHGRVLFRDQYGKNLIVWDPISDAWQEVQVHDIDCKSNCFVVLCAVTGCDHHDCRGGPFLVVYLGAVDADEPDDDATGSSSIFRALVYSSEDRAWGPPVSSQVDGWYEFDTHYDHSVVIGDKIYCVVTTVGNIVKYDLVKRCISLFSLPPICHEASDNSPPLVAEDLVLTENKDGALGLASIRDSRLHLWSSRTVNHDGKVVAEWAQESVIELDKILPIDMNKHSADEVFVAGFAEGARILFICTYFGTFTFELKSGRVRKITESTGFRAFPLVSFFTPLATGRAATSAEPALKKLYVDSPYEKGDCSRN